MGSPGFDPYHKWLGIPPEEQPPSHYRLLGIKVFETDPDVIANAADKQMAHVRTFQSGQHSSLSQRLLNQIAAARVALLNPDKKRAYDAMLRRETETAAAPAPSPISDWHETVQQVVSSSATTKKASSRKPWWTQHAVEIVLGAAAAIAVGLAAMYLLKTPREPLREPNVAAEPMPTPREPKPAAVEAQAKPAAPAVAPERKPVNKVAKEPPGAVAPSKPETKPVNEVAKAPPGAVAPPKPGAKPVDEATPVVSEAPETDTAATETAKDPLAKAGSADQPELPPLAIDKGLTQALNDFSQWRSEHGDWRNENGSIIGSGDSALCFNRSLPERFVLEFAMNVREGMRPRIRFAGFHVGNEGYSKVVSIHGAHGEAVGPGFEYQNQQEMKLRIVADGEELKLFVNGSLVKQASREKSEPSPLKIEGGDFWSKGTTSFSRFRLGRIPASGPEAEKAKGTNAEETTKSEPPAKKSPAIVLALLRKKLHGRVTYSSKTGYFTLTYDWASKQQLQDFGLHNANVTFVRGSLALPAGQSVRHVVDFKDVVLAVPVLVPEMRGTLVQTSGGAKARLGGQWPDTMYLEGGGGDPAYAVVPENVRKGIQPIQVTVTQNRLGFLYGSGNPTGLSKPVAAFHAGQVELFGGERGFQYGKLVLAGAIDETWLQSFAEE